MREREGGREGGREREGGGERGGEIAESRVRHHSKAVSSWKKTTGSNHKVPKTIVSKISLIKPRNHLWGKLYATTAPRDTHRPVCGVVSLYVQISMSELYVLSQQSIIHFIYIHSNRAWQSIVNSVCVYTYYMYKSIFYVRETLHINRRKGLMTLYQ